MEGKDLLVTVRALEFMSYGIDITGFSFEDFKQLVNVRDKCLVSRVTPNVQNFLVKFDSESVTSLDLFSSYIYREGHHYRTLFEEDEDLPTVNLEVSANLVYNTMNLLKSSGVCSYDDIDPELYDPNIRKKFEDIAANWDRKANKPQEFIKGLSNDNVALWYKELVASAYKGKQDIIEMMMNSFKYQRTSFNLLKDYKDYEVIDNRIFIALSEADLHTIKKLSGAEWQNRFKDMKYIVISKNLYDYFFCSYGSDFQSCFALNSPHRGWYGMVPFGTFDSHYIIYGTKEKPQKSSMDGTSSKWTTPFMFWRCWGWTSTDGQLLVDKVYGTDDTKSWFNSLKSYWTDTFKFVFEGEHETAEASAMSKFFKKYRLVTYPDSITFNDNFKFERGCGTRSFTGSCSLNEKLTDILSRITEVTSTFDPVKPFNNVEGRLCNPKTCPKTGLLIAEDETESRYAKYINEPVQHLCCLTYIDNALKVDAVTERDVSNFEGFSPSNTTIFKRKEFGYNFTSYKEKVPLKVLKEYLKGYIKSSPFDTILLRIVEGDVVTVNKYKKAGVH